MNELSKQILEIIKKNNGIKAVEVAKILGCDKKLVNSALYSSRELKNYCWQDSSYKWYANSAQENTKSVTNAEIKADPKLSNICKYYLSCLNAEASNGVSAFLTSKFDLQYVEIDGIEKEKFEKDNVINFLKKNDKQKSTISYFGYPILIDKFRARTGIEYTKIYPVFLYTVEYNGGAVSISEYPSINIDVIKHYSNNSEQENIYEQIQLEDELGISKEDADIQLDELIMRLMSLRQWEWKEEMDPYEINTSKPLQEYKETGIFNKAVIITCEKSPYTVGLESELADLSQKSTENIKGTALYDWIYNKASEVVSDSNDKGLLEVLPLNSEQYQAVETALTQKTTIVTGPPGTGKSQVVTDILVNMAYNNKSVLFSSKNNQAVLVVDTRINGLANKPVMIKVGGTNTSSYLASLIEGLLSSFEGDDLNDYEYFKNQYEEIVNDRIKLNEKKKNIYNRRNDLDKLEQKVRTLDDNIQEYYSKINDIADTSVYKGKYYKYLDYYNSADKNQQSFFIKLFWNKIAPNREEELKKYTQEINQFLEIIDFKLIDYIDEEKKEKQKKEFDELLKEIDLLKQYKSLQDEIKKMERLEDVDFKISDLDNSLSNIALHLWQKWTEKQSNKITVSDRKEMSDYVAAVKLLGNVDAAEEDPSLRKQIRSLQTKMTNYLPCWAVTSLSAKGRVPFQPAIFDLLIIDEASQCDIASILPLLYRAKRTVIIGDDKQLTHITSITNNQDKEFIKRNNIEYSWSYSQCSLYHLASSLVDSKQIIGLRDHHRSCADIVEFSNKEFYDGRLRIATNYNKLHKPKDYNLGIRWIDVQGECIRPNSGSIYNTKEIDKIIEELKRLVESDYEGTIGVVTPFKLQAEKIGDAVERERELDSILHSKNKIVIDTVHKFQGDEKDVIIFSPVISNGVSNGAINFLSRTGNLFNVAITRAKATLIVVGDIKSCSECPIKYMTDFVKYYEELQSKKTNKEEKMEYGKTRDYPEVPNEDKVSEWEKKLYTALFDNGIKTIPQYSADKYFLDLAIIKGDRKLDIEVDGAMYHRDWNGELCYRDRIRNNRLKELGWDVKRFWVQQVRDELSWCIEEIKKWIEE